MPEKNISIEEEVAALRREVAEIGGQVRRVYQYVRFKQIWGWVKVGFWIIVVFVVVRFFPDTIKKTVEQYRQLQEAYTMLFNQFGQLQKMQGRK